MKKKIIFGSIIVVVLVVLIAAGISKNSGSSPVFSGGRTFTVSAVAINKGDISSYVTASGATEEIQKAEVYFETPLKVKKLLVNANDTVKKGQKLVEVDMDSLNSQLEKLIISRDTQLASMGSKATQTAIVNAKSGLDSAQRAFNDAQKNLDDSKALYEASAISKAEYDRAESALKEAKSALEGAKVAYDSAISGKDVGDKTNSLNLRSIDLSISDLQKQIDRINEASVSPMDGAIAALNILEGSYTSNMQPAFVIVNTEKVRIKAYVREYDIRNVQAGQAVKITGDAIEKEKPVEGKVTSVSPIARVNRTSGGEEVVIDVLIEVTKTDSALRPGLNVNCEIYTVQKKDILVAPMNCIKEDKDGNKTVMVIDSKTKLMHEKSVKLGISSDMMVEVLEGLKEGDMVVLDPQPAFRDGSGAKVIQDEIK